jgi:hypothetical protein
MALAALAAMTVCVAAIGLLLPRRTPRRVSPPWR